MEVPRVLAFIGVDPGVTCGISWGTYDTRLSPEKPVWQVSAASCDDVAMRDILAWRLREWQGLFVIVQAERFVTGNKPGTKGANADATRAGVHTVSETVKRFKSATFVTQSASDVKSWATDKRLAAIGFPLAPKMRDARDAGRHMLFAAVRSGRARDPLY